MPRIQPSTLSSRVVPTEYDVKYEQLHLTMSTKSGRVNGVIRIPFIHRVMLIDDRGRRFTGRTLAKALARADRAQDPADPIHHQPFPSPKDVPRS